MSESVRVLALTANSEVLLEFRDGNRGNEYDYTFVFLGGKIDNGETPLQAAVREFSEETGLTVTPEDFKHITTGKAHVHGDISFYLYTKPIKRSEIILSEGAGFAFVKYTDLNRIALGPLMQWFIQHYPKLPA